MAVDQRAAESFIWRAARLLDRHRYALLFADGSADLVLARARARSALPRQPAGADAARPRRPKPPSALR